VQSDFDGKMAGARGGRLGPPDAIVLRLARGWPS